MGPALDETYEPRWWHCDECQQILGVVMRDTNRIRRLWVFRMDRCDEDMPTTFVLRNAPRGLFKIHGVDSCQGVECSKCGARSEWSMSKESFDQLMKRYEKAVA